MIWMNPPKSAHNPSPATMGAVTPAIRGPMRVLIFEADPVVRLQLRHALAMHRDFEIVAECSDASEAARDIPATRPDLVFCGWELESAVALWRALRPSAVLAVMAQGERRAAEAFELGAIDFLLKPIALGRLDSTLARARMVLRAQHHAGSPVGEGSGGAVPGRLVLKRDGEYHFVAPQDIIRAEAQGDFVKVFTVAGAHLVRTTLARLLERLDPQLFLRVHRSHVINCTHVAKVGLRPEGDYVVTLKAGGTVPVARAQAGAIRRLLT